MLRRAEKGILSHISGRRLLYCICFCIFCVIDQRIRTANSPEGWLETFRDLTGVIMAVIIMSHYRFADYLRWKIPYLLWTVVGGAAGVSAYVWAGGQQICLKDWFVILLDIFLFGYILIHTFLDLVIEKKRPGINKKYIVVWLLMMVLMIVSRSEQIWPICYLIMFGCFYLTDYDRREQEELFQGMLDGVILSFFLLQGLAFVFRPYDEIRYKGIYFNPNVNALFYLEVLAAVLAKLLLAVKRQAGKWIRVYYWLGVGVVLSFLFMTVGRTAWAVAVVLVAVFLWAGKIGTQRKGILKRGLLVILCACLTFPACFAAARYFPPFFHHPIWFGNEWNENRVFSWDPWDSEKYVEIDEFLDYAVGKLLGSIGALLERSPFQSEADAADRRSLYKSENDVLFYPQTVQVASGALTGGVAGDVTAGEGNKAAVDAPGREDAWESMETRIGIYKYYISRLNLLGNNKKGDSSWGWHGHNIFLQYGTDFGVIVLALFLVIYGWNLSSLVGRFLRSREKKHVAYLMFSLITLLYGMLELTWGPGSIGTIMMFFAWGSTIRLDTEEKTG